MSEEFPREISMFLIIHYSLFIIILFLLIVSLQKMGRLGYLGVLICYSKLSIYFVFFSSFFLVPFLFFEKFEIRNNNVPMFPREYQYSVHFGSFSSKEKRRMNKNIYTKKMLFHNKGYKALSCIPETA